MLRILEASGTVDEIAVPQGFSPPELNRPKIRAGRGLAPDAEVQRIIAVTMPKTVAEFMLSVVPRGPGADLLDRLLEGMQEGDPMLVAYASNTEIRHLKDAAMGMMGGVNSEMAMRAVDSLEAAEKNASRRRKGFHLP